MSSALVTGNFGLYAARHTLMKTTTSNGPGTPFFLYSLQLQLSASNGTSMDGTVRVYAPSGSQPLPDGTVAYIHGKVHIAPEVGGAMLEPIYFFPYPGDPEDDAYEAGIPDMVGTTFTGLGTVVQSGSRNFVL
ncbi:hypothetical protein EWM64_g4677 [Hericium alpestre]|uniref:Uncharacterized protein n=1 Tax=Hericium alpestre TaxID=135208 RepID=A0A4Y9ZWS4_9AGAM|nr:hypothetical protein EWM64_g4677 [Hericium alpestre]